MKLDHEEEPQLSEPYLSKHKKLMVSALLMPRPPDRDNQVQMILNGRSEDALTWKKYRLAPPIMSPLPYPGYLAMENHCYTSLWFLMLPLETHSCIRQYGEIVPRIWER